MGIIRKDGGFDRRTSGGKAGVAVIFVLGIFLILCFGLYLIWVNYIAPTWTVFWTWVWTLVLEYLPGIATFISGLFGIE